MNKFGTTPTAESIPFVDGAYTSTNLKDAIVEAGNKAAGGVVDHGVLTGLLDDDHPQYLKTDGTRALTGDLDLGGNDLINVTTVDGVDIAAHSSRHLPSGADPLTTGIPSSTGTANSEGIVDAFARQDHVHNTVVNCENIYLGTATSTTSASYTTLNGMILETDVSGTFLITATATARHTSGGGRIDFAIFINGTRDTNSTVQCYVDRADQSVTYSMVIRRELSLADTITIRWLRSSTGTATASGRSLTILRVG